MKKFLIVFLLIILTGCTKEVTTESFMEGLQEFQTNLNSYYANVSLEMINGEDTTKFECEIYYLKDDYYKVILHDVQTNNIQAIVKNQEGVFVLTPLLNKQYKFANDWPLNSSHAYLYQSLVQDITNDDNRTIIKEGNDFVVTSAYNCKTNASLKQQKVTFSENYIPLYCIVTNEANETMIKATYNDFSTNYSLKPESFDTQTINTSLELEMGGEGNYYIDLEDVKPTYYPEGTTVTTTASTDSYNSYSYEGETNCTIYCTETFADEVLTTQRLFDDVILINSGVAFLNEYGLMFYKGNIEVCIYYNDLDLQEIINIANSF